MARKAPPRKGKSSLSVMENVMSSKKPIDHDKNSLQTPSTPPRKPLQDVPRSIDATILHTPRRGRRVGGVSMGWDSPHAEHSGRFAGLSSNTFPISHAGRAEKHSRPNVSLEPLDSTLVVTPRKRRAETSRGGGDKLAEVSLIDSAGRASAGICGSQISPWAKSGSVAGCNDDFSCSPLLAHTGEARTKAPRYDRMAGFGPTQCPSPVQKTSPALVAVERKGMGRVAVHRELADYVIAPSSDEVSTSNHVESSSSPGHTLPRSSDTDGSAAGVTTASTVATSIEGTPCPMEPSPSFSLSSHFPVSEPSSPNVMATTSKIARVCADEQAQKDRESGVQTALLQGIMHMLPLGMAADSASNLQAQDYESSPYKPRLGGALGFHASQMPTLDWPDCPYGPWSAASKQISSRHEKRKERIAKWLEEDSDDGAAAPHVGHDDEGLHSSMQQQHPMVAKVMRARARKETLSRCTSLPNLPQSDKAIKKTPRKSSRRSAVAASVDSKVSKAAARQQRKLAKAKSSSVLLYPPSVTSLSQQASRKRSKKPTLLGSPEATIGCTCGKDEDDGDMVGCDACFRWYHLSCVGINSLEELAEACWICSKCSELISAGASPSSPSTTVPATSIGGSIVGTPSFPRSTALAGQRLQLSQGQLPVFAQPMESPRRDEGQQSGLSSALALAPSPQMPSSDERRSYTEGRPRASRIGWHIAEPSSPLDRKSSSRNIRRGPPSPLPQARIPTYDPHDPMGTPFMLSMGQGDEGAAASDVRYARDRTPSPKPPNNPLLATPTRHARNGRSLEWSGGRHRRTTSNRDLEGAFKEVNDIFSTPSRILDGSSWSHSRLASGDMHGTPSHSALRHSREESNWALMSTPTRGFMDGAFNSEHSAGLPSLIFSSGGGGGQVDAGLNDNYGLSRAWQLQSPTSSTRAANRVRQASSSSGRNVNTSSLRNGGAAAWDSLSDDQSHQENPPSSSPFPRTPTFPDLAERHHLQHPESPSTGTKGDPLRSSHRLAKLSKLSHQGPMLTSSPQLREGQLRSSGKTESLERPAELVERRIAGGHRHLHQLDGGDRTIKKPSTTNAISNSGQLGHVSGVTDPMTGLGIGLDLEDEFDVLSWS